MYNLFIILFCIFTTNSLYNYQIKHNLIENNVIITKKLQGLSSHNLNLRKSNNNLLKSNNYRKYKLLRTD
jgi:hypothetical protein